MELIEKKNTAEEEKIKEDFKKRIKALLAYYKDLNKTYSFSKMNRCKLYNTLKKINKEKETEFLENKCFVQIDEETKLFDFGQEVFERQKNCQTESNLIEKMNAFPIMGNKYSIILKNND